MKQMYKKPSVEVMSVDTESMMQDLNVSVNSGGTPPGGGGMHAPRRGEVIPD